MATIRGSAPFGQRLAPLYCLSQILESFVLARSMSSRMTNEGTMVGRAFYVAPELAPGHELDGGADLHSLGAVFYQLANRRLPFIADDRFACPPMPMFQGTRSPNFLRGLITHGPKVQWGRRRDG